MLSVNLISKLNESNTPLDFTITKWDSPEVKESKYNQIINTNKPVHYSYTAGFDRNGVEVTDNKIVSPEELKKLISYKETYFVLEKEDKIIFKRQG